MNFYWLSFCDGTRKTGEQFLGCAVVGPCDGFIAAVRLARERGCNPGGEVVGMPFPVQLGELLPTPRLGVLLDVFGARVMDELMERLITEYPELDRIPRPAPEMACAGCNVATVACPHDDAVRAIKESIP